MFAIVMTTGMGSYFLNARKSWVFDLDMAETFTTREAADAAYAMAARNGKRGHFATASVQPIN